MTPWQKYAALALAFVACAMLSGIAGGGIGFLQGALYWQGDNGLRSYRQVLTLRDLRAGRTAQAIDRLERGLDAEIIEHAVARRDDPPLVAWLARAYGYGQSEPERKFFGIVAKYRAEYPSTVAVQDVREAISAHLKKFEEAK